MGTQPFSKCHRLPVAIIQIPKKKGGIVLWETVPFPEVTIPHLVYHYRILLMIDRSPD